jgi:hypothetical protein
LHGDADHHRRDDGEGHIGHLHRHQRLQPVRRLAAGRGQDHHSDAEPHEGKAQRHHDRGQVPHMDQGAHCAICHDQQHESQKPKGRVLEQQGCAHATHQPDEGTDREVEVVHRDHEHLRNGGERNRHRVLQHQIEPEIAHGARLYVEGGGQHDGEREEGQRLAQQTPVHAAFSAKEACSTFSSVSSSDERAALMAPLRNT